MNNFLEHFAEILIAPTTTYREVRKNFKQRNFYNNDIKQIKEIVFSPFYYYIDFSLAPFDSFFHQMIFHKQGLDNTQKIREKSYGYSCSSHSLRFFSEPRILRDILLAWSMRKDFYKYHIKFKVKEWGALKQDLLFLESILPLEENMFFLFDDGFYICNPINNENLIKIKDYFKEVDVFVNDHELYFDLDKDKYNPRFQIEVDKEKNINFTYFFAHIDLFEILINEEWKPIIKGSNLGGDFLKDKDFFKKYDKPVANWIKNITRGIYTEITLKAMENYCREEWKRIPSWYQQYVTEDMLEIQKDEWILKLEEKYKTVEVI